MTLPDDEIHTLIAQFEGLDTASVSDALDKLGIHGQVLGIAPLANYTRVVVGPAFTVSYVPIHKPHGTVGDFIDDVKPGDVVVIDNAGRTDCTVWGDIMTQYAGIKGLVIDGGVRDIAALRAQQFPVFARGISVKGTRKSCVPSVGKPMHLCATPVSAGDWVIADDDGVVILPVDQAHAILQRGKQREQKEADMMNALREGKTSLALMGLSQWSLR